MKKAIFITGLMMIVTCTFLIPACKKPDLVINTTEDVNIVGYLEKYPDSFSLFKQILDRTGNSSFLNAYGAYTCFAPSNSGVKTYLQRIGAATVDAADLNTLKDMVKLHLLEDTVYTGSFTDGKLPVITMYGQFLVTAVKNDGGVSSYIVNRQASVTKSNIRVGNGVIHVIDNVLLPATKTIAKQLEEKPEFSIFVQALQATGYFTLLNTVNPDTSLRWYTVFAESNQALADSGINKLCCFKNKIFSNG